VPLPGSRRKKPRGRKAALVKLSLYLSMVGAEIMESKIQTIFTQDIEGSDKIGTLGIDKNGNLYWNEKRVITEQVVKLQWWVDLSIFVGGLSTAVIAILTCLLYFKQC
jgi:hypothetical protein